MRALGQRAYRALDRAAETRAALLFVEGAIATAQTFIAIGRNALFFAGLAVAILAFTGSRDPNLFPFYVDGHLVGSLLLASLVAGFVMTGFSLGFRGR